MLGWVIGEGLKARSEKGQITREGIAGDAGVGKEMREN